MAPRTFGATKFRNAVPAIPHRDEWYRTALPGAAAAPPNTSAYSSVVKTSRELVITLAPNGDASVRSYAAVGASEGDVWSGKLGPVADWDISRLEDGGMVVAGNDGTVSCEVLDVEMQCGSSSPMGWSASHDTLQPTWLCPPAKRRGGSCPHR